MAPVVMRGDDPTFQEFVAEFEEKNLEPGFLLQSSSVDRLLRKAFAIRETSLIGGRALRYEPNQGCPNKKVQVPEKLTEAAFVIEEADRNLRPRLKHFIWGYYGTRPSDKNRLVRILGGKIFQDAGIGPDHRAWKVLHRAIVEHCHPEKTIQKSNQTNPPKPKFSAWTISRETGLNRYDSSRSYGSMWSLMDEWREELEEVLMPVFVGKGWVVK